ncbi:rho GTPase-activating protein 7-like isoform X2 [Myxocyprinus asiaticus]|uniref:rho GTPase-activating protein 7-like isoform X2 n=1 Tax=Myxocyprinus asiaticus TaxID=70543 RepID=UPI002221F2E1|nr:rho GTPase-activating protein 7-like isoform X2 [Myxocyprinus asiaticus]
MLITKIEAKEACDWLCAAGFPQYAQLFNDSCFPIDIDWVKSDHEFLDKDAIDSLCRRLSTLIKCVEMKLELSRSKRRADEEEEEDLYAISPKWSFDRKSRRWIRVDDGELIRLNSPISSLRRSESCEASLSDSGEVHELSSTHSSSNADSDGGCAPNKTTEEPETSLSSSRCSSNYKPTQSPDTSSSRPPSPGERHTLSGEEYFPEKSPVKKGKSLLRKMEKLRLRGNTIQPHTESGKGRLVISGPIMQEGLGEERLKHLQCLDIARLLDKTASPVSCTPSSGSSSSPSESSSVVSTPSPVTKVRSNCKRPVMPKQEDGQNQINEQDMNNQRNLDVNPVFEIPHAHKPGTFPKLLTHNSAFSPIDNTSVNWRTGSFHGYRGRRCKSSSSKDQEQACSPLATYDHRASIYDNVPDHVHIMNDDVFSALDSVMERICGLQQLVTSWTDKLSEDGDSDFSHSGSPSPSSLTDIHLEIKEPEETDEAEPEETCSPEVFAHTAQLIEHTDRTQRPHWSSVQILSLSNPSTGIEAKSAAHVSMLQRLSLLRLTALMDKYSLFSKQGWNWTVPKVYRKVKSSEHKSRQVFGVPLLQGVQQSGKPLPPSILRAMEFLRTECLDQVGLFRKSGVKSRIQNLRDMVEADPESVSFENQSAFDVADMVKQYFRDLPEPIFSSKLCESFLHIYQYFPKDQQFAGVQAAIYLLPDENREALQSLFLFLQEVVACVEENQMTPTNIAVCLAPSLFHLNSFKRDRTSMRSRQRKYSLGRPDQRDLSENLAATQGLAHMVTECSRLFQIPKYWESFTHGASSFTEDSLQNYAGPSSISHFRDNELTDCARLALLTQKLLREAREKSKGWTSCSSSDHVNMAVKKVEDGNPLRLWRGTTEVDAPQQEVFHRVLREHNQWQRDLMHSEVVETLDKNGEVYHYILQAAGARAPLQHVLLRTWQSDSTTGSLFVSSTSVEHASVVIQGVRAQVFCCFFLIEPLGSKKSRVTHLCRTDTRGRSPEWHHKVGGHLVSSVLMAMRNSFRPKTKDSKGQQGLQRIIC